MFLDDRYSEQDWRNDADARERDEIRREARDLGEYYAETPLHRELPAIMRDDAGPIGMSCESDLEQARRRAPGMDYRGLAADLARGLKEVA